MSVLKRLRNHDLNMDPSIFEAYDQNLYLDPTIYPLADAQPRHRATRTQVAVPIVAHILGAVFDSKTSMLGSPGVILAPLASILVAVGSPGAPQVAQ